jgi:3-phenylpropionate/trans-cinnamate dioxygenase ferredoxin reductase subunit
VTTQRCVLVGGGVAAVAAAAEMRAKGYDGDVVLVSDEDVVPYQRPPLSKAFLTGEETEESISVYPESWYDEQSVELLVGERADQIDVTSRTISLATGRTLGYDQLVIATGARARRMPGVEGERILHLRSQADGRRMRGALAEAGHVVVVGGGFIGCEIAATATGLGKQVTVLEADIVPMRRAVGSVVGNALVDIHRENGVDFRTGVTVRSVTEAADTVVLETDRGVLSCDLLVVGVGSVPNVELAARAGLDVAGGVRVDEFCRTAVPGVFAVGDVAAQRHPFYGRHLRVEHHETAVRQGATVGRSLAGKPEMFADSHWFWSDQYDHSLQCAGVTDDPEDLVFRGSVEDRSFSAFSLRNGRIVSVVSLNRPRDVLDVRRLLFVDHEADAERLGDESVSLKRLAGAAAGTGAGR